MSIITMVITGWRYVPANVGLWQIGGGAKVPDIILSMVWRGREGLRWRALHHVALLRLLLITLFLSEEKKSTEIQKVTPGLVELKFAVRVALTVCFWRL